MSELMDLEWGWWVVAYTEMAYNSAAFVLQDTYHNLRLWAVSRDSIPKIRALNQVEVLGNQANADECLKFLSIIESKNFSVFPATWSAL